MIEIICPTCVGVGKIQYPGSDEKKSCPTCRGTHTIEVETIPVGYEKTVRGMQKIKRKSNGHMKVDLC